MTDPTPEELACIIELRAKVVTTAEMISIARHLRRIPELERRLKASDAELRLRAGELTAGELRAVRAVLNWVRSASK